MKTPNRSEMPRPTRVAVTWSEFQKLTGYARATVGKAIMLLEGLGAITMHKVGRANHYELIGVDVAGDYCQLPQSFLESNGDPLSRFKDLPATLVGFNALKLYFVLLTLRSNKYSTTSISYSGITRWTGIRREDIRKAWGYLDGQQLATISMKRDERHHRLFADDQNQRYAIFGLTSGFNLEDIESPP